MAAVAARAKGGLPPASPFAELLRSSRFASYDPSIKQTYGAPPAYARRGNWGLKRPISKRRSSAYITLKSYEDHAQYTEWNSAEGQVRYIRRFEELNITPTVHDNGPWAQNLGPVRNSIWLTDSEFDTVKDKEYRYIMQEPVREELPQEENLEQLGQHGPGEYGAKMRPPLKAPLISQRTEHWDYRRPNIDAMNVDEFESYLEKLREMRPEFLKTIRATLAQKAATGALKSTTLRDDLSDLQLSVMNSVSNDHNSFLNDYYEQQYARRDTELAAPDPESGDALPKDFVKPRIKPQPHRSGGLMYAHPTLLDTYFTTEPRPAFYLQSLAPKSRFSSLKQNVNAVSFGGVVSSLESNRPLALRPLFTSNTGPSSGQTDKSVVKVRVSSYELEQPPTVVGRDGQGLNGIVIKAAVVESPPHGERPLDNPETPGSAGYVHATLSSAPMLLLSTQSRGAKMKAKNLAAWKGARVKTGIMAQHMKNMALDFSKLGNNASSS